MKLIQLSMICLFSVVSQSAMAAGVEALQGSYRLDLERSNKDCQDMGPDFQLESSVIDLKVQYHDGLPEVKFSGVMSFVDRSSSQLITRNDSLGLFKNINKGRIPKASGAQEGVPVWSLGYTNTSWDGTTLRSVKANLGGFIIPLSIDRTSESIRIINTNEIVYEGNGDWWILTHPQSKGSARNCIFVRVN